VMGYQKISTIFIFFVFIDGYKLNDYCKSLRAAQDLPPDPRFRARGAVWLHVIFNIIFSDFVVFVV
jgi:hypothetical protein